MFSESKLRGAVLYVCLISIQAKALAPCPPAALAHRGAAAGGEVKRLRQEETLIVENLNAMVDGATHDDAPVAVDGCVDKKVFAAARVAQKTLRCCLAVGCNNTGGQFSTSAFHRCN